jgi:hypothetical protein
MGSALVQWILLSNSLHDIPCYAIKVSILVLIDLAIG